MLYFLSQRNCSVYGKEKRKKLPPMPAKGHPGFLRPLITHFSFGICFLVAGVEGAPALPPPHPRTPRPHGEGNDSPKALFTLPAWPEPIWGHPSGVLLWSWEQSRTEIHINWVGFPTSPSLPSPSSVGSLSLFHICPFLPAKQVHLQKSLWRPLLVLVFSWH